jgi:hypothetical protein
MILSAITDYDIGYSLEETAARLQKKSHRHVSPSTIRAWLEQYQNHCPYRRLRSRGLKRYRAPQTIRSIKLYHWQVYAYAYHRPKLEFVRAGTLDDKRPGDARFAALADFLENVPTICPHDLFRSDDDPKARASQARPPFPIWLTEHDIAALEHALGIELVPNTDQPRVITGHIDFLQVRNGAVHVLDYKPDARTNKPIGQLAIYALALTRLVPGLKLFDIKCAWFNEKEYCEFFPRTLCVRRNVPVRSW